MNASTVNIPNTPTTKNFFDANILLESALKRKHKKEVDILLHASAGHASISVLTVHLVVYFASKDIYLQDIRNFLDDFIVLPINNNDVSWTFDNLQGNDFEDALQLACAVNSECDNFVTLDQSLIKRYEKQAPINFITF